MKINLNVIKRAIKEAKRSDVHRGKVGAVLFSGNGKILTSTHNVSIDGQKKRTIHAEERILLKANKEKIFKRNPNDKICLLVIRWRQGDDSIGNAKPCANCEYVINKFGVKTYYSDENGNINELL